MTELALRYNPFGVLGPTSGGGTWRPLDLVKGAMDARMTAGTSSSEPQEAWAQTLASVEATSSGLPLVAAQITPQAAVAELRRRSGLTWDQLAALFGVSRRSVHFWASGATLKDEHEDYLWKLLATIRYVDRGSAGDTRRALTAPGDGGVVPLDLLQNREFEEVRGVLGRGAGRPAVALQPLSVAASQARLPPPPEERVGMLQDPVHLEVGATRAAKTVKVVRKR